MHIISRRTIAIGHHQPVAVDSLLKSTVHDELPNRVIRNTDSLSFLLRSLLQRSSL